eukprot:3555268-Pleurochrysis_carterae.AAC.1
MERLLEEAANTSENFTGSASALVSGNWLEPPWSTLRLATTRRQRHNVTSLTLACTLHRSSQAGRLAASASSHLPHASAAARRVIRNRGRRRSRCGTAQSALSLLQKLRGDSVCRVTSHADGWTHGEISACVLKTTSRKDVLARVCTRAHARMHAHVCHVRAAQSAAGSVIGSDLGIEVAEEEEYDYGSDGYEGGSSCRGKSGGSVAGRSVASSIQRAPDKKATAQQPRDEADDRVDDAEVGSNHDDDDDVRDLPCCSRQPANAGWSATHTRLDASCRAWSDAHAWLFTLIGRRNSQSSVPKAATQAPCTCRSLFGV